MILQVSTPPRSFWTLSEFKNWLGTQYPTANILYESDKESRCVAVQDDNLWFSFETSVIYVVPDQSTLPEWTRKAIANSQQAVLNSPMYNLETGHEKAKRPIRRNNAPVHAEPGTDSSGEGRMDATASSGDPDAAVSGTTGDPGPETPAISV